jgi:polyisoprenoid-binding protein YceI
VASVSPGASGTPSSAAGTVLPLAEGSEVKFKASKVTKTHEGGFRKVTGSVAVPDSDLTKAAIDITIDMTSTYSDDEKLTGHLASPDFFDVAQYPTSTFKSTAIAKTADGYLVTGDLTLHGVTQSINFPAEITLNANELTAKTEFSLNRKLFKIEYPGKPDDLIRDEVVILFDLKAGGGG